MLKPLLKYGFDGMVAGAGGFVTCGDEVLFDCPMEQGVTDALLAVLHKNGVFCTLETKEVTYGDEDLGASFRDRRKETARLNAGERLWLPNWTSIR